MKHTLRLVAILAAASGASACVTGRAQTPTQRPALEVPPPPPRVVEPLPAEPAPPLEPVADLPPATSTSVRNRPAPRDTGPREAAKPDPKPEPPAAAAPETASPAPTTGANPAPQIRTPDDNSETARQVRDILDRASKALASIDYRPLTRQRKESYDTAKRFIQQAEDAIKASNFVYARFLADKADILSKELQGR
jgi:hypothetical protein